MNLDLFDDAPPPPPPPRAAALRVVAEWAERGWLRRLDAALARFVAETCPDADAPVLFATALLAHVEGQGHTCLVLDDLAAPDALATVVRWTGDATVALAHALLAMPASGAAWAAALARCSAVHVDVGGADDDGCPLVLADGRLYLRRYWAYERRVAADLRRRMSDAPAALDTALVRSWLDRLFDRPSPDDGCDWQKVACAVALSGRLSIVTGGPGTGKTWTAARFLALLSVTSPAPERLRIALAAPTGKAAARLRQSIDAAWRALGATHGDAFASLAARLGPARTLHALLGTRPGTRRFRHDASHPLDVDVVVVDEASMIHVEMMDALLAALPPTARLLLLGDKDQLASVEAGAVLGELCRDADRGRYHAATAAAVHALTGEVIPAARVDAAGSPLSQRTTMLRLPQRFDADIAALAQAVNAADAERATALLSASADGPIAWIVAPSPDAAVSLAVDGRAGAPGGYRGYLDAIARRPSGSSDAERDAWIGTVLDAFDRTRVLCAVRDGAWGVEAMNRAIAVRLAGRRAGAPQGEWYEGRPVVVTRNDAALGVFNGDVGIALAIGPVDASVDGSVDRGVDGSVDESVDERGSASLRVCFAGGDGIRSVGVGRLGPVETAFAMTVHKSQGSEFDHTVLVLPPEPSPVTTRELAYTGVTRARSAFTLVSMRRDALAETLVRSTHRSSGLLGFIDATTAPEAGP